MRRFLVTGANGFIGTALKRYIRMQGDEVIEFPFQRGDITQEECFTQYTQSIDYKIDHVFHLAAKTYVPASWEKPQEFYKVNVTGTLNILELCRKHNLSMTFFSAYIYGQPNELPIAETHTIQPNNPYAHSKYMAEQLCEFYAKEYDVAITTLRPFNVYGAGQADRFLIPSIIRQALFEYSICVQDLHPRRDYVYIDDVIDAMMKTLDHKGGYSVYNIGSGNSVSVGEVIELVLELCGRNIPIVSQSVVRANEINDVTADVRKAKLELGWIPHFSLGEGLSAMLNLAKEV